MFNTYTINHGRGVLVARDDAGAVVAEIPSDTTITASTDSHDVVNEFAGQLGQIESVDHDGDIVFVTVAN